MDTEYEYGPFGEIVRSSGAYADANPFRFSTKYRDNETGFYYYGYRHYDPTTGRWSNRDPIQEQGGLNLYGFIVNDPVNYVDFLGFDTLCFDGSHVRHYDDEGNLLDEYPATSGQPGETDTSKPFEGPIPEGDYTLNPNEISEGGFLRSLTGDWGDYRAPLHPNEGTDTQGRDNFFMHGGDKPGSAGCIDVGNHDSKILGGLENHEGPVDVKVNYPESGPPDWSQGSSAPSGGKSSGKAKGKK